MALGPEELPELTDEQRAMLEELSRDELLRRYLETLERQTERHDGGGRWIGTGGHSPFGHGGEHPTGIRVGGPGQRKSAMKVAEERHFRDYRTDEALDLRGTVVALKRLRQLTRQGRPDELDLDETVDETCRNAGEIELVFRPERKNNVRLLLLMDVGGSMDPYYQPVSRLLTALHAARGLRDFRAYYFHNCVYENVYGDARLLRSSAMPTGDLFRQLDERWKVAIVGDAAMHPHELMSAFGNIDPRRETETPGHRLAPADRRPLRALRLAQSRPGAELELDAHDRGDRERVPDVPSLDRRAREGGRGARGRAQGRLDSNLILQLERTPPCRSKWATRFPT